MTKKQDKAQLREHKSFRNGIIVCFFVAMIASAITLDSTLIGFAIVMLLLSIWNCVSYQTNKTDFNKKWQIGQPKYRRNG